MLTRRKAHHPLYAPIPSTSQILDDLVRLRPLVRRYDEVDVAPAEAIRWLVGDAARVKPHVSQLIAPGRSGLLIFESTDRLPVLEARIANRHRVLLGRALQKPGQRHAPSVIARRVEYPQGPLRKWPLPKGRDEVSKEVDAFMNAVDDLDRALDESVDMVKRMRERIEDLRKANAEGRPLREIVPEEQTPLLVQLLTESTNLLHSYGNRVRRTEARALHGEGMTMDEIAKLFGVTRQRISALLRDS